ncbi:MAG: hypothetical protein J5529_04285 [Prevotella sp.]|nr:hypothetical protein [Prevotella sp.]
MKGITSTLCRLVAPSCLVLLFTSCATMLSGTKANIIIQGDVDEPVTIVSSCGECKDVTLPTHVKVKRRHLDGQHIQISSEHHTFDDIVLKKAFNEWAIASVLFYGVPFAIDLMTNAVSRPKYDSFYIRSNDSISPTDTLRALSSVYTATTHPSMAYLHSRPLPEKFLRHEVNGTIGLGRNQASPSTHSFIDDNLLRYHLENETECFDLFGESYIVRKVEYHYRLNRKWDVGAFAGWGLSCDTYREEYDAPAQEAKGNGREKDTPVSTYGLERCRTFSFAPSVRYTWYETRSCRLFSRVAVGMMRHHRHFEVERQKYDKQLRKSITVGDVESTDDTKWQLAYQLSPIGVSVGGPNLRFFAELGYGCLGVVNIGVSLCF